MDMYYLKGNFFLNIQSQEYVSVTDLACLFAARCQHQENARCPETTSGKAEEAAHGGLKCS